MTSDSPGLWAETAPPAPPTEALSGEVSAQVAVVGGGYTGLSAALHLAQAGVSVALVEAAEIGGGGSGRNVGLVNAGLWLMPEELVARASARLLDALAEAPALVWDLVARHKLDCEAMPYGTLHCAPDARGKAALTERARQWQARGAGVELLDAARTRARTGSRAFRAALYDPRAGTIQPLAYARGLAAAALGAGARLFTNSPVSGFSEAGSGYRLSLPGGSLLAERVILATNTYSTEPFNRIRDAQSVLPYFNFATAPLPEDLSQTILPRGEGAWDTRKILTSFRRDAGGRLIIGSVGQLGRGDAALHRAWAERALRRLYPQLGPQRLRLGWWGRIGTTPDALPRLHRHAPGVWSISGYNGRGIAPGTLFGAMLADLSRAEITETDIPLTPAQMSPDPLRLSREALFRAGSAALHLVSARI
ncbi:MAG: FAD-binding oxidoreductase [Rhodobacteraceae bacterium]|nr:MAG: FAD-binding oxidoreductase [Paracoccaceae bacterium]